MASQRVGEAELLRMCNFWTSEGVKNFEFKMTVIFYFFILIETSKHEKITIFEKKLFRIFRKHNIIFWKKRKIM